ncbi:MAG: AraC family transcriptional regulator [Clostridia bacterium]|nr:AraC family transcriptional regulator [Clostridia bacterium]
MENERTLLLGDVNLQDCGIRANYSDAFNKSSMTANHYHGFYELYFWMGDEMTYVLQDRLCRLRGGDILIIRPYVFHRTSYMPDTRAQRLVLYLGEEFLGIYRSASVRRRVQAFLRDTQHLSPDAGAAERIRRSIMEEIIPDFERGGEGDENAQLRAELGTARLLIDLSEMAGREVAATPLKERLSPRERHVSDAVAYINAHYHEPLTLDVLAGALYVSPTYLCQLFRRFVGLSVVEYLRSRRLIEAQRLLSTTDMTISQIGERVGFGSGDYFIKTFRKAFGQTPGAYREEMKEN